VFEQLGATAVVLPKKHEAKQRWAWTGSGFWPNLARTDRSRTGL